MVNEVRLDRFSARRITLRELGDDQWVAVAAILDGRELFENTIGTRFVLPVKMRDFRQHAIGGTTREQVKKTLEINRQDFWTKPADRRSGGFPPLLFPI